MLYYSEQAKASFSILYRIVRGERALLAMETPLTRSFSILYRIVRGESWLAWLHHRGELMFQYPLSDREG